MDLLSLSLGISIHVGMSEGYNSIHPNIRLSKNNYMVGLYYNSEDRLSVYAGKTYSLSDYSSIDIGIVSGYNESLYPFLRFKYDSLFIAPGLEEDKLGIIVGIEIPIK